MHRGRPRGQETGGARGSIHIVLVPRGHPLMCHRRTQKQEEKRTRRRKKSIKMQVREIRVNR